jgi:hypothetical protein
MACWQEKQKVWVCSYFIGAEEETAVEAPLGLFLLP